ncbi:TPA: SLC13/DASS family transporter [Klebsiella pneumoniae MGH 78578]|uniref:SLC13/DASS family transporter n=2 Tax=Klebsiella pneumoniae complex TaxID=3390273 RepID=A0A6B2J0B6_KLEPN|nr:cation transporter [Klebsiella pneumoniae]AWL60021.1 SLC13/DASS family transporter [Klebsiella quasipneumoniae]MBZ7173273.1 SLC13/DASS family transporter [Klebsiella variicola]OYJ17318.1 cation transporter [Klebsiella pneumoniae subsp. pneumoniae]HBW8901524.1 SLC13/DASS family transporter [Klebsiella quasipneumoniae subsp. quasipneumoniae]HBY9178456.1 SLC13/DASS family transporter [Klebsiella pneumoniae MGH 78578]
MLILVVAIIIFISDRLPMGLVAFMVPMALYFFGVIGVKDIFASIVNENVILIIAMCVLGAAFFKTGLAWQSSKILLKYAKTERSLSVLIFMISGVMSAFVSNSGTVAVLIPIVLGIAGTSQIKPIKLLMPLVFGATIGADISIIGSPGNLIAKNTIETFSKGNLSVPFFEYAKIGIPLMIACALLLFFFGSRLIPDRDGHEQSDVQMDYSHIPEWHKLLTLIVFVLAILGMVATDYVKFLPPIHIIACCAAIVLVLTGVLNQKETFNSFETLTVFMLAFMMPLGAALNSTGAGEMIARAVISVTGNSGVIVIMASLWILTWALTQVMSNTAACTLLCPVGWTIAQSIGADPRAVVIAIFIASSVAVCTPMAIPANSMIIGPGNVKFKDFLKPGLAISFVCFIVSMILLPVFYPFY